MAVTLSDREIGRFEQVVRDLQHRARNDRQVVILLEAEVAALRREIERLKVKAYTAIAVTAALGAVLAWGADVVGLIR